MKDRTEHFRDIVRRLVAEEVKNEEKKRRINSSLIFRRAQVHTPFITTANEIRANIRAMHAFILQHRQDYLRKGRMTERERDDLEQEVGLFVKTCRQRVDVLKNAVSGEAPTQQTLAWIGGEGRAGNTNLVAHWHGVVLILSERLHSVTAMFDRMRAAHFEEILQESKPARREGIPTRARKSLPPPAPSGPGRGHEADGEAAERREEQVQEYDETRALQLELAGLAEGAAAVEGKVLEMTALSHLFSTRVLQQAQQIEQLYNQAVEATTYIKKGNTELRKTVDRNSDGRIFVILFFVIMILAVLFLDWYSP